MLTVTELAIPEVKLLMPRMLHDERGTFAEIAQEREMQQLGLPRFVQENQSLSLKKNTLRGLHAQKFPHAQAKLLRVLQGRIFDVAVDARPGSETFGKHVGTVLDSEGDITQMFIPAGFLHGFCTLTDNTIVLYKVSDFYAPGSEVGVMWNDPDLGIEWPVGKNGVLLSGKDAKLPPFKAMGRMEW